MVAEQDIVTQHRMQLEDFRYDEFFHKVLVDYDFLWAWPYFCECRDRIVCYGMYGEDHATDDAIHQLLVKDVLVAMVYERRTDFNFASQGDRPRVRMVRLQTSERRRETKMV